MYGMLLQSVQHYVQEEYGVDVWKEIIKSAEYKGSSFNTHQVYPDEIMGKLANALAKVTSTNVDKIMEFFGKCFVRFFSNFGYDVPIRATGRYFTDFVQNVDNIHTQFRFSYPKMKSPSIYLTDIDENGCDMVYRSERTGFIHYINGLLTQISQDFFGITDLEVKVTEDNSGGRQRSNVVKFRLNFNNQEYMQAELIKRNPHKVGSLQPVPCYALLELFPFGIMINTTMEIMGVGEKIVDILGGEDNLLGQPVHDHFALRRPKGISFAWKNLLYLRNILFELELKLNKSKEEEDGKEAPPKGEVKTILLKGQMKHIEDVQAVIFLCSPVINDIDELTEHGIYLSDLNHHGLSKEMVMAGWQHNSKLEMLFDDAEQKSHDLEDNYDLLDTWKKRSDDLLYSMIPKSVADRMRDEDSCIDTCETFECITVLFCEIVGLHSSTVEEALAVVDCLNAVFSCFDALMDKHQVYKVETVGYVYMAAGGAPERTDVHAQRVASVADAMIRDVKKLKVKGLNEVEIRIGIHSGSAVAGVVGLKTPRYCFFGDTINTASRMQSTSTTGNINISVVTKAMLPPYQYKFESRGLVKVKGKGEMETFFLTKRY